MHKNKLPKYFLFVDKYEKNILKNDICKARSYCNRKKFKFYISNNLRLAIKFKADGIYIPSFNKRITLNKATLRKNFKIIGSAHNQMEIKKKIDQGCEAIFLSSVFRIEKSRKYLGVCRFGLLTLKYLSLIHI